MNKTVNINIGGLFFHIDENAYNKLNTYLNAIKYSLAEDSKEEVMNDIEARIGEILSSRIQPDKQVVNSLDIEYIISIMGQPEDYIIENETTNSQKSQPTYTATVLNKKLYRDEDEGRIGGVCAGLGHYFGIDSIWIRLLFIVLFFSTAGTSLLIYLILWVIVPKALTTSEKLQMKGEPINIANIEKKIKESFDTEELNRKSRNAVSAVESFAKKIFNVISKLFGGFLLFISVVSLGSILVFGGTLILGSFNIIDNVELIGVPFETNLLPWFAILLVITAGIPLLFLFALSLKVLNTNFKFLGRYTTLSLLVIWFLSLIGWTAFGINQASQEQYTGKTTEKIELNLAATDTLKVNFNNNSLYSAEETPNYTGKIMLNENGEKVLYSNRVDLIFKETDGQPYVVIEKEAKANDMDFARSVAQKMTYLASIDKNVINADNYYTSTNKNKRNKQSVNLYIYIPQNTIVKLNKEARYFSNTYLDSDQDVKYPLFKFNDENQLNCINCSTKSNQSIQSATKLEQEVDSIVNAIN